MADSKVHCKEKHHNVNEAACLFCDNCEAPVCTNCITSVHRGHTFSSLDTAVSKIKKNIRDHIDSAINENTSRKVEVQKAKESRGLEFFKLREKISERYDSLRKALDQEKQDLLSEVKDEEKKETSKLKEIEDKIDEILGKVTVIQSKCREAISKKNSATLLDQNEEFVRINSNFTDKEFELPVHRPLEFRAFDSSSRVIGELVHDPDVYFASDFVEIDPQNTKYELEVLSRYQTKFSKIESICMEESEAWIGYSNSDRILRLKERNGSLEKVSSRHLQEFKPINVRLLSNGNLIFATAGRPYLKIISGNDEIKNFTQTGKLLPLGLYVNKNDEVLVCLLDDYTLNITAASIRKVAKFSKYGKTQFEIEYDGSRSRLFHFPQTVTENCNADICVVDVIGKHQGRLLVFDSSQKLRFTYVGTENTRHSKCDFSSCTHDRDGNIIISDEYFNQIHYISKDGQFLGFLATEKDQMYFPFAVELDTNGFLWIGCKAAPKSEAAQVLRVKFHKM